MSKLQFASYEFEKYGYTQPPEPSLNGGLYTGEPFQKGAPHANFPVTPDTTVYLQTNLQNGTEAPNEARYMYPPSRQGNSHVEWKGLNKYEGTAINSGPYNIYCGPCTPQEKQCFCEDICPKDQTKLCNKENCVNKTPKNYFSKYYYIV